jgi:hypothetical protein
LIIVALVSLLAAAGIGTFYVQRLIIRRLTSIGNAMRRLSEGDGSLTRRRPWRFPLLARNGPAGFVGRSPLIEVKQTKSGPSLALSTAIGPFLMLP